MTKIEKGLFARLLKWYQKCMPRVKKKCKFYAQVCHLQKGVQKSYILVFSWCSFLRLTNFFSLQKGTILNTKMEKASQNCLKDALFSIVQMLKYFTENSKKFLLTRYVQAERSTIKLRINRKASTDEMRLYLLYRHCSLNLRRNEIQGKG